MIRKIPNPGAALYHIKKPNLDLPKHWVRGLDNFSNMLRLEGVILTVMMGLQGLAFLLVDVRRLIVRPITL